jgi:hypothetical protein
MTRRILVAALAVWVAALGLPSSHRAVSEQGPAADRMAIVVSDEPLHLQVWRAATTGYEKVWEATPRVVDPATWNERQSEQIASPYDGGMKIADIDGDGSNELVVVDAYGITVYGRTPAYYSFPAVENTTPTFTVADVDGDGAAEIVTQRMPMGSPGEGGPQCEIEVLKVGAGGLTSIWKQPLPGLFASAIPVGDVDNDGEKEIISGSDTVTILKRRPGPKWEVAAELAASPTVDVIAYDRWVQIADVDSDGKNEIIIGGGNGKITIFKSRKVRERVTYGVLWQSANLMADGMTGRPNDQHRSPSCIVSSVAVADADGDKQPEIVAGTGDYGRMGQVDISGGRLHIFRFNGRGDFTRVWVSDWISPSASIAGVADVDGDGANEIVVNGRDVYKRDGAANTFRPVASLLPTARSAVVGPLPDLREPSAVRIVPLYWSMPGREVVEGETLDVTVTLRSVWSAAKDVTLTITPDDPAVQVSDGSFKISSIPANGIVTTPVFKLTGRQSGKFVHMRFDLTAANGYRQSVTTRGIFVLPGNPTYLGDVESRVAGALARARDDNKRVLIQWGSNADPGATALISVMRKDSAVATTLVYEYEVVRADVKGAERLAAKYKGRGAAPTPPYFTVLDAQGQVLASQAAAAFKKTRDAAPAYDTDKLNAFLTKFKPTYLKAEPLLTEALSQAKMDQKTVFLWFSAPT